MEQVHVAPNWKETKRRDLAQSPSEGSWLRRSRRHHRRGDSQSPQSGNQPLPHYHRDLGTHKVGPNQYVTDSSGSLAEARKAQHHPQSTAHCSHERVVEDVRKRLGSVGLVRCLETQNRPWSQCGIHREQRASGCTVNKAWRDPDGGYVAAMDFSKAFDHMAPELSKQAMIAAGWPENIATLMADVWKAQKRTVCFGGQQDPPASGQRTRTLKADLWDQQSVSCGFSEEPNGRQSNDIADATQ